MTLSPDAAFWELRFAPERFAYGTAPNVFLAAHAARVAPGQRWFVPGDGEGRNGVFLATLGAAVDTRDLSPSGVAKSRALAASHGVTVNATEGDLRGWSAPAQYDGIASVFLHFLPEDRPAVHRAFVEALKPGGVLIVESYHPEHLKRQAEGSRGGPQRADMLYTPELLAADFAGLTAVSMHVVDETLHEGALHEGRSWLTRAVFQKP